MAKFVAKSLFTITIGGAIGIFLAKFVDNHRHQIVNKFRLLQASQQDYELLLETKRRLGLKKNLEQTHGSDIDTIIADFFNCVPDPNSDVSIVNDFPGYNVYWSLYDTQFVISDYAKNDVDAFEAIGKNFYDVVRDRLKTRGLTKRQFDLRYKCTTSRFDPDNIFVSVYIHLTPAFYCSNNQFKC